ncbi:MAG: transposase [Candidatus Aminicenantes bacterium]|nr:transposase [Candidatus Aminicenantes bacterium]
MPRIARVVIPGCPHHLIQRGNRRLRVFFSDEDKAFYLTLLNRQIVKHGISIWAFCLMDNHVHIIAVPKAKDSFALGIGEAHRKYTSVINTRQDWKGYLWQGRFITYPLDDGHLFSAIRYVERNPVRVGVVCIAESYAWSSAWAHVTKESHPLLSPFPLESGISDWSAYLKQKDSPEEMKKFIAHEHTGRPLGSEDFIRRLEELTGRVLAPKKRGRKKSEIGIVSPI